MSSGGGQGVICKAELEFVFKPMWWRLAQHLSTLCLAGFVPTAPLVCEQ